MVATLFRFVVLVASLSALLSCGGSSSGGSTQPASTPNILYIVMDDIGVDQIEAFGYGGDTPPSMPNLGVIANSGVRFHNTWSMPECSPGRAAMFVGRYPFRTNVYAAIGTYDLANSQLSPYDMTVAKLLKQANYESGMFGKFHIAGPDNNEAGNGTPQQLGWDYFYGWIRGGPANNDPTAGGVSSGNSCGFIPSAAMGGADTGACYQPDGSCKVITGRSAFGDVPGKQCLHSGGVLVPNTTCQSAVPSNINFTKANGYYVSPLVINSAEGGVQTFPNTDSRNRGYRTTIETDAAISWINSRQGNKPWMATVSYSAAHTPYQQPPGNLVKGSPGDDLNCDDLIQQRVVSNKMTEALDTEFGRLLVQTGLATRKADGSIAYDPKASNTMIVIVGDNGTFPNVVKEPFDMTRAKSTAYQTGVWVPLIVAGPLVVEPNRKVTHMTNMVDVFQLFGEMAGIDVPNAVPRVIDSASLLPYLTNPSQSSIRNINFTQGGYNVQANGQRNGACLVPTKIGNTTLAVVCTQSVFDKSPCEGDAGVWWGPGYTDPSVIGPPYGQPSSTGYRSCWQVNQAQYKSGLPLTTIAAEITMAVRNDAYKLVRNQTQTYFPATDTGAAVTTDEFYQIDQAVPTPKIDKADLNLMPSMSTWSSVVRENYNSLLVSLNNILASQPACNGDANIDGVVDSQDLSIWQRLLSWALSSIADFNLDGLTNDADAQIIRNNQGTCAKATAVF